MAEKSVGYKEPSSYFSPAMRKAVKEYDRKKAAEVKKSTTSGKKSK